MNKLRRIFTISVMVMTVVVMSGAVDATKTNAAAQAGDLIKMDGLSAVYYLGDDGQRYVFPNESTYMSWYSDFSGVVTVPSSELQSYPIGGNVTMRPGTNLVKITTDPTVYAVEPGGELRSIVSEDNAIDLYGEDWADRVVDVPDAFFVNYEQSSALTEGQYPTGTLLQEEGESDVYYVDNGDYRMFDGESAFLANNFKWSDVVTTDMNVTASGSDITGYDSDIFNPAGGASTGGDVPTGSGLSVALSASTPAAATVPSGATGVTATEFNVTASNDGDVVLDSLVVTRSGVGDEAKIDKVYLYEGNNRLTTGRSISDSTQTATFSNINYTVAAGTTKTLSLVMDVVSSGASGEHVLGIASASAINASGATVSGSFPVRGNTMSLSGTPIGQVDVEENTHGTTSDSVYDYTAYSGESDVEVAKFNVLISNVENGAVESIRLYNAGRDVAENYELYRGSEMVATGVVDGDYVNFELSTPYEIEKGNTSQFKVMADIVDARAADTVELYVRYKTDVRVMGDTYGYYLNVANHDSSDNDDSMISPLATSGVHVAKTNVEAGQVTFVNSGTPLTNNVALNSNDVALLDFNITTQTDVDVEQVGVILKDDDGDDGDLSNLELVCDGSIKSEWANPTDTTSTLHTDTSVWTISANETVNCTVRVDIENDKTPNDIISADVDVDNWTFKDTTTGDTITDVIPSTDLVGNDMTVVEASVTGATTAVPTAKTWVAGQSFEVNGFNFTAGDAEAVTISSLSVTGYYEDGSADGFVAGGNTGAMKDVVSSVELYIDGEQIGTTQTLSTAGVATFNSLNWDISAGATEKVVVKVNTAKGSVDTDDDNIKFAVTAASAEYTSDGTTLGSTIDSIDEPGEISIYQTVTDSGSIAATLASDTPNSDLLVMGTDDVVMTKVKFSATNEDFVVEKLQVENVGDATDDAAYLGVKVRYTDSNGDTQTATGSFSGDTANFSGLDIFVEKDEDAVVELLADLNTSTGGASNDVTTSLDMTTSEFRAIAQGSGTVDATGDAVTGNDMYIYKSVPTVAFNEETPSGIASVSSNAVLAKIDIHAANNEDITFTSGNSIKVEVATSGASIDLTSLVLKDGYGNILDTAATASSTGALFEFGGSEDLTISADGTETLVIYGDTTPFGSSNGTLQVWLDDVDTNIDWGIDGSGNYNKGNIIFKGDLYGGTLQYQNG